MPSRQTWLLIGGWLARVALVALFLAAGLGIRARLAAQRREPEARDTTEPVRTVTVMRTQRRAEVVRLTGYGTVRLARELTVRPQVGGAILRLHPGLEVGTHVAADTLLLAVDPVDHTLALALNEAEARALDVQLQQLEVEQANTERLLEVRRRNRALVERDRERTRQLFAQDRIATQTDVDRAEQALVAEDDRIVQLENALRTLPPRRAAIAAQRALLDARMAINRLSMARCEVRAPIAGRITAKRVEAGQFIAQGEMAVTIADDTSREISVALAGDDVARWLVLTEDAAPGGWFAPPAPVPVAVRWVDGDDAPVWQGVVDRIEAVDERTRTAQVIVRVPVNETNAAAPVALVTGMFCEVVIPGRTVADVAAIPRDAVNEEGGVYVITDGRLAHRELVVAARLPETLLVTNLADGTLVVTSKILSPVLGMRVAPAAEPEAGATSQ